MREQQIRDYAKGMNIDPATISLIVTTSIAIAKQFNVFDSEAAFEQYTKNHLAVNRYKTPDGYNGVADIEQMYNDVNSCGLLGLVWRINYGSSNYSIKNLDARYSGYGTFDRAKKRMNRRTKAVAEAFKKEALKYFYRLYEGTKQDFISRYESPRSPKYCGGAWNQNGNEMFPREFRSSAEKPSNTGGGSGNSGGGSGGGSTGGSGGGSGSTGGGVQSKKAGLSMQNGIVLLGLAGAAIALVNSNTKSVEPTTE